MAGPGGQRSGRRLSRPGRELSGGESHPGAPQGRGREPAAQGRGARPSLIAGLGRLPRSPVFSKTFQPSPLARASQAPDPYIHLPELGGGHCHLREPCSRSSTAELLHLSGALADGCCRALESSPARGMPSGAGLRRLVRFRPCSGVTGKPRAEVGQPGIPLSRCPQMESLCFPTACQACAADPPAILGCCLLPAVQYLHTVPLWKIIDIKGKAVTPSRDGGQGSTVAARCPARSASLPSKPEADKGRRHRGVIPLAAPQHLLR